MRARTDHSRIVCTINVGGEAEAHGKSLSVPKAILVHRTGGPEVLSWEDVQVRAPGPGEVRVRHTHVGLNFIDTYQRAGLYKVPLPFTPGQEAAGVVEAI